ncbi:MAG: hypothetical protein PHH28_03335 [Desulfuromonadaceae bacterium]|nr:hypothetical protein [Desulfuromonadaceae bacterium]
MIGALSNLRPDGSKRPRKRNISVSEGTAAKLPPLGLLPVPNVAQGERSVLSLPVLRSETEWFRPSFLTSEKPLFFSRQAAAYAERMEKREKAVVSVPEAAKRSGFALHRFRSGELTGARFTTGLSSVVSLNPRSGALVTQSLTQKARTKIRRAIQNATHDFKCFMTVTFAPCKFHEYDPDFVGPVDYLAKTCKPWEHNFDGIKPSESSPDFVGPRSPWIGSVRHDFAKYKFKKFFHSIKQSCDRKADKSGRETDRIAYVWVAEIQLKTTNNIHFHALLNHRLPIKWLTSLWAQSSNSIDVRSINNLNHASCYLRKYMEKDKSAIQGNRYAITQGLRKSMEPEKTVINGRELQRGVFGIVRDLVDTIELNGGKVLEHGFYLPTPCRSVVFRGKDSTTKKSIAVSAGLSVYILNEIKSLCESFPF